MRLACSAAEATLAGLAVAEVAALARKATFITRFAVAKVATGWTITKTAFTLRTITCASVGLALAAAGKAAFAGGAITKAAVRTTKAAFGTGLAEVAALILAKTF